MSLVLRTLRIEDKSAFFAGLKEWEGEDSSWYSFTWEPGMRFEELLQLEAKNSVGECLPPGYVPATMFYGFVDDIIVGRLNIRHTLTDNLRYRGGHIGYAVAPRYRQRGYATEMFRQALLICRKLGIGDLLVTCADDNPPSWRIIEKFSGVLENKVWDSVDEEIIRRYWIRL